MGIVVPQQGIVQTNTKDDTSGTRTKRLEPRYPGRTRTRLTKNPSLLALIATLEEFSDRLPWHARRKAAILALSATQTMHSCSPAYRRKISAH